MSIFSRPQTTAGRILKATVIPKALWDDSSQSSRVMFLVATTVTVLVSVHRQNINGAQAREIIGQNEIIVRQNELIKTLQKHLAAATG